MQRQDVIIHSVKNQIEKTYKNILLILFKHDAVVNTSPVDTNLFDSKNYHQYKDFVICDEVSHVLDVHGNQLGDFCRKTFNLILSVSLEFRPRFNSFDYPLYDNAQALEPHNAMSEIPSAPKLCHILFWSNFLSGSLNTTFFLDLL